MAERDPVTSLSVFSSEGAAPTACEPGRGGLRDAEVYWLTTVRPDGRRDHFTAPVGTWCGLGDAMRGGDVLVFRVEPSTAFGFGKGETFSQTRWRFVP